MVNRVVVFAGFKAKKDKAEELRHELLSLIETTRAEDGCRAYELHEDLEDHSSFMFYEEWRSREDLECHLSTPPLVRLLGLVPELCSEPLMVKVTKTLA